MACTSVSELQIPSTEIKSMGFCTDHCLYEKAKNISKPYNFWGFAYAGDVYFIQGLFCNFEMSPHPLPSYFIAPPATNEQDTTGTAWNVILLFVSPSQIAGLPLYIPSTAVALRAVMNVSCVRSTICQQTDRRCIPTTPKVGEWVNKALFPPIP